MLTCVVVIPPLRHLSAPAEVRVLLAVVRLALAAAVDGPAAAITSGSGSAAFAVQAPVLALPADGHAARPAAALREKRVGEAGFFDVSVFVT